MKNTLLFQKLYLVAVILFISVFTIGGILYSEQDSTGMRAEDILQSDIFRNYSVIHMRCDLTAYCPGPCCNSGMRRINGELVKVDWSDKTAVGGLSLSGLMSEDIHVMAVDPDVIPLGSIIYYQGKLYFALDTGGMIQGRKLDVLVEEHDDTFVFGKRLNQKVTVFIPVNPELSVAYIKDKMPVNALL